MGWEEDVVLTCSASSSLVLAIHHAAAACSADDGGPDGFDMLMQFGSSSSDEVYGVAVPPGTLRWGA